MGCFDTISVFMRCPYCKKYVTLDAQTKDMDSCMWNFEALDKDWFGKKAKKQWDGRSFRKDLPVFPRTPYDKSHSAWKDQKERIEALARVDNSWGKQLRFVSVIVDCRSPECAMWAKERDMRQNGHVSGFGRQFSGKIRIVEHDKRHYFIAPIYDIVKIDNKLPRKPKRKKGQEMNQTCTRNGEPINCSEINLNLPINYTT